MHFWMGVGRGGTKRRARGVYFWHGIAWDARDLPNLHLLLPLLQNPSRLISVFKLASNALLTFQTPHAPLAIDAP